MLENQDLNLSRSPEKNHFAFSHPSWSFSLAWLPKFCAPWDTLSWKFATFWAPFSDNTAHATLFTDPWITFHAHVTTFHAVETVQLTTDVHTFATFVAVVHTTFAVVDTVHWIVAFPHSNIHLLEVASEKVFQIHSLRFCQTHLIHSIAFCHVSFSVSFHWLKVFFTESTHWEAADFTHSIPACQTHLTFSTPVFTVFDIVSLPLSSSDFSFSHESDFCSEFDSLLRVGCSIDSAWKSGPTDGFSLLVSEGVAHSLFSSEGHVESMGLKSGELTGVALVVSCVPAESFEPWDWAVVPVSCVGVTGVPTFCSSCVCVIIFV